MWNCVTDGNHVMSVQWCYVCADGIGEPPTASPIGHPCTVRVDRDPRACHDVQDGIMTERQLPARLFGCVVVVVVAEWSRRVHLRSSSHMFPLFI